mgnify:CR=1 FL=1
MKLTTEELRNIIKEELEAVLSEGDDRCTRIAKRKYDVWPSAYASGAVVRCRKGEIWKDLKEDFINEAELSDEENAATDSLFKSYVKESEEKSERKSIESMRDEVIKILDEVVEEDSTVTITFNMQWTPSWVN